MSIELAAFQSWLDDYGRAWESRDPRAAAELFTEAGTYQVTPFLKPMCGRKAIFEYWEHVARTEKDVRFGYEILAVTVEVCIARWWATFVIVPPGLQIASGVVAQTTGLIARQDGPKRFPSDTTRQRRSFPVPFKSPPKSGQQIPACDFRAHSLAELKPKIKIRNPDFYALSGFVQGIHRILSLYREIELLIRLTRRNSTVFEGCASKCIL